WHYARKIRANAGRTSERTDPVCSMPPLSTSMMSLLFWIRIFTTSRQTSCLCRSQRDCSQDSGPGDGRIGRSQYSPSSSRAGFLHNSCYHEERQPVFR
ncbi:hypothetical protein PENTCL1PPCAC_30167, partial [Pristionchus entomophagus]